ncbi:alpha/beta fold hydrolase [Saccharopolyspora phatthalungensis]|uniref:10-carbomethoxy-13-deoxycarminomycin esterase/esterase n=1 Tax=Saccharopolyspora phatthalungensis TaxID=664693 RepID=A0A840QHH9_9PSEU|nr:alpha/beta fold hydrolase [Saccharopolyspora phatthalungensis]MBB5158238.1 10-carbomethoxy-13-deoxycarminomycin esterase/esterase [Saccharopolyspora phatthalungensis]
MPERRITTPDGLQLWTESRGDPTAPPVLLIMGANANALGWPDEFVDTLAARRLHVLRYDHRDTGRSTHLDITGYSLADMARDAVAVLDGHGIATAHVVGLSLGGTLGQLLALDHRHRLRTLTLMVTAALDVDFAEAMRRAIEGEPTDLPTPTPRIVTAMAHRSDPAPDRDTAIERRVAQWRLLAGDEIPFDAAEFRRWENAAIEHAGSYQQPGAHAFASPVPTERGAELRHVTTPTLIIQGPLDPINPPPHGQHLADLIPGARCTSIPGLGHALPSALHQTISTTITDHIARFERTTA